MQSNFEMTEINLKTDDILIIKNLIKGGSKK
jgi:hypothetical protein